MPVDFNERGILESLETSSATGSCFAFLSDDFLLCLRPALVTITTVSPFVLFAYPAARRFENKLILYFVRGVFLMNKLNNAL